MSSITIGRSSDATTISPALVFALEDNGCEVQTLVHPILGTANADITLRPASRPSGRMRMLFLTHTDALAARTFHAAAATFTLTATTMPWLPAAYVPTDRIEMPQQTEGHGRWVLEVPYQEIAA